MQSMTDYLRAYAAITAVRKRRPSNP